MSPSEVRKHRPPHTAMLVGVEQGQGPGHSTAHPGNPVMLTAPAQQRCVGSTGAPHVPEPGPGQGARQAEVSGHIAKASFSSQCPCK